jgi:hypothetical protein
MQLQLIESKGDVTFWKDEETGKLYQQLASGPVFKVKDGKISYKQIAKENQIDIKYQNNGCNGFSLFKAGTLLEDNIWTFADAQRIAKSLN